MPPLDVLLANELYCNTVFAECVVEIQPLTIHRLQNRGLSECAHATAINFRSAGSKPSNAGSAGNSSNSFSEPLTGIIETKSHCVSLFLKSHKRNLSPAPGSPLDRRFRMYSLRIIHLLSRTDLSSPRIILSARLIQVSTQLGEACGD